jgi:hypothetical protein
MIRTRLRLRTHQVSRATSSPKPNLMSSIRSHVHYRVALGAAALSLALSIGLCRTAAATDSGGDATPEKQESLPAPTPAAPAIAPTLLPQYKFEPGVICPLCELTPQFPLGRSGLHWHGHWRQAGVREYVTISALAAGTVAVRYLAPPATSPSWTGPILFDSGVRNALRIDSAGGRKTAATISDGLFIWEVLHPTVLDPLVFAWWLRESPFVAWQMMMIDAQAYAFTFFMSDVVKRVAARQRPWVSTAGCEQNGPDGCDAHRVGQSLGQRRHHRAPDGLHLGLPAANAPLLQGVSRGTA